MRCIFIEGIGAILYSVIKGNLPKTFSGRINIDESEDILNAQFTISDTFVTVMPLTENAARTIHECSYNVGKAAYHHRWFYGFSELNSAIAILQNTPMQERFSSGVNMGAGYFSTPIIVHGSTAATADVSSFNAIEFHNGVLNYLYSPSYAIGYEREKMIVFKNEQDNTHEYEAVINGEKIKVVLFIRTNIDISYELPDLKNNISSVLRFEFEENKGLDDIEKYYNYALRLFQFCTGRLNVRTDISIFNLNISSDPICVKMNDGYSDYANDRFQPLRQIGLLCLGENFPKLLSLLNDNEKMPYLEFFPAANKYSGWISYTQVIDLCVSFEKEHKKLLIHLGKKGNMATADIGSGEPKDSGSKSIEKKASDFTDELIKYINAFDIDQTIKDKACGILSSQLKNFSPSLKEKMFFIYDRYKVEMQSITEQKERTSVSGDDPFLGVLKDLDHETLGLTKFYSEEEFKKKIKDFTHVRGSTAHAGIKWNGGEDIYMHLVLLIYYSILERAGYGEADRSRILSWLFYHRF